MLYVCDITGDGYSVFDTDDGIIQSVPSMEFRDTYRRLMEAGIPVYGVDAGLGVYIVKGLELEQLMLSYGLLKPSDDVSVLKFALARPYPNGGANSIRIYMTSSVELVIADALKSLGLSHKSILLEGCNTWMLSDKPDDMDLEGGIGIQFVGISNLSIELALCRMESNHCKYAPFKTRRLAGVAFPVGIAVGNLSTIRYEDSEEAIKALQNSSYIRVGPRVLIDKLYVDSKLNAVLYGIREFVLKQSSLIDKSLADVSSMESYLSHLKCFNECHSFDEMVGKLKQYKVCYYHFGAWTPYYTKPVLVDEAIGHLRKGFGVCSWLELGGNLYLWVVDEPEMRFF